MQSCKTSGENPRRALGVVCCIGLEERLKRRKWLGDFLKTFETQVAQVAEVHRARRRWEGPLSYQAEMGGALSNVVFVLASRISLEDLIATKRRCMELEETLATSLGRTVNINPGVVSGDGLLLASHKGSPLRVQVSDHVYLERQQAVSADGRLVPLPNAFTEYLGRDRRELLARLFAASGSVRLLPCALSAPAQAAAPLAESNRPRTLPGFAAAGRLLGLDCLVPVGSM